jgi:glutaredoxin
MIKMLTTHCPRCDVLKKKLDAKNIQYEEITDEKVIESYGVDFVPALVIGEEILDFNAAVIWVNSYYGGNQ